MNRVQASRLFQRALKTKPDAGLGTRSFCRPAHEALQGKTLAQAWKDCTKPAWMLWWLDDHLNLNLDQHELNRLWDRQAQWFSDPSEDSAACDRIRAHFTYWGERKQQQQPVTPKLHDWEKSNIYANDSFSDVTDAFRD